MQGQRGWHQGCTQRRLPAQQRSAQSMRHGLQSRCAHPFNMQLCLTPMSCNSPQIRALQPWHCKHGLHAISMQGASHCHAPLLAHCEQRIRLYCMSAQMAEALGWVALQAREAKRRKREAEREAEKRKREAKRRRRQQEQLAEERARAEAAARAEAEGQDASVYPPAPTLFPWTIIAGTPNPPIGNQKELYCDHMKSMSEPCMLQWAQCPLLMLR